MSKKILGYSLNSSSTPPAPASGDDVETVDIEDILKQPTGKVVPLPKQEPKGNLYPDDVDTDDDDDPDEPGEPQPEPPTQQGPQAKFNQEEYARFKEKTGKLLGDYVKNPKKVTKVVTKFGGMLRMLLYPFIYKLIIFDSGYERMECEKLLRKIAEGKKAGKEVELNPYEIELKAKWDDFQTQKKKIMFSEEEISLIAEVFEDKIKELPIGEWIEKYDWLFVLLYVESKRFVPVAGIRMKNNILRDFELD